MVKLMPIYSSVSARPLGKLREALIREQHNMLRRVLPALYATMIITLIIFSISFESTLPDWFNLYIPVIFFSFMSLRLVYWVRSLIKGPEPDMNIIRRDLRLISWVTPVMALSYSALAILPTTGGDTFQITIAVLVVWCVALITSFSISTLPITSIAVILCATIPISINFALHGNPNLVPLTTVFVSLSLLVIYTNTVTYRTFVETIISQWRLTRKNGVIEGQRAFATRIAYTDTLTGLPNRRSFYDALDDAILQFNLKRTNPFAVAIVDLDGFKPINDVHGHGTGDAVLIEVGERLEESLGDRGMVARLGGDEFAIIANDVINSEDAILLGNKLVESLRPTFEIDMITAHLSGSCGFCLVTEKGAKSSCVLERADLALYKAKSENRGYTEVFTKDMEEKVLQRSMIEQALRIAISNNDIEMQFQPIVDLKSQKIIGMEALARWDHAYLGSVPPSKFIPIAEHSGLISELTENLFRKAVTTAKSWPSDIFLSFNISAGHLTRQNVSMNILSIMLQQNFSPNRLEIEVTETAIMRNMERARATIANFKQAGIRISLDDFGTGYSSMNQVRELPFDKIKIDKSFTDGVCDSERTRNVILSVIGMCKNLNISCLAEGIEREEQRQALIELGCGMGQGYLFGKSMSGEESIELFGIDADVEQKKSA